MMNSLNVEELKSCCRDKKPVFWHPDWVKVRKHQGEDFFSAQTKITITKIWEDELHPEAVGVSFLHNKQKEYIAIDREGKAFSRDLNFFVFAGE